MIHGPCGASNPRSPFMHDGKCSKYFPKRFNKETYIDGDGYPCYKRLDNGVTVDKDCIEVDNRYVVAYNPFLLLKYNAHINVEWCNQSRAIKYLFKYINKGQHRITVGLSRARRENEDVEDVDEIQEYYNCRYVSTSEVS